MVHAKTFVNNNSGRVDCGDRHSFSPKRYPSDDQISGAAVGSSTFWRSAELRRCRRADSHSRLVAPIGRSAAAPAAIASAALDQPASGKSFAGLVAGWLGSTVKECDDILALLIEEFNREQAARTVQDHLSRGSVSVSLTSAPDKIHPLIKQHRYFNLHIPKSPGDSRP